MWVNSFLPVIFLIVVLFHSVLCMLHEFTVLWLASLFSLLVLENCEHHVKSIAVYLSEISHSGKPWHEEEVIKLFSELNRSRLRLALANKLAQVLVLLRI